MDYIEISFNFIKLALIGTCEQSVLRDGQTKKNKHDNKQVKQIKQAKLMPYQVTKLNIRNSTKPQGVV